MRRLMAGEPMPKILEDLKRQNAGNQKKPKRKCPYTKDQIDRGLEVLETILSDTQSLLLIFGFKKEAAQIGELTPEVKRELMSEMDEIVPLVVSSIQNLKNQK
jgi:hypothetical protein